MSNGDPTQTYTQGAVEDWNALVEWVEQTDPTDVTWPTQDEPLYMLSSPPPPSDPPETITAEPGVAVSAVREPQWYEFLTLQEKETLGYATEEELAALQLQQQLEAAELEEWGPVLQESPLTQEEVQDLQWYLDWVEAEAAMPTKSVDYLAETQKTLDLLTKVGMTGMGAYFNVEEMKRLSEASAKRALTPTEQAKLKSLVDATQSALVSLIQTGRLPTKPTVKPAAKPNWLPIAIAAGVIGYALFA